MYRSSCREISQLSRTVSATPFQNMMALLAAVALFSATAVAAEPVPQELVGDWSLDLESGTPGWMRVVLEDGQPQVFVRFYIGSAGPYNDVDVANGRLKFEIKRKKKKGQIALTDVNVGLKNGQLDGLVVRNLVDGTSQRETFSGTKIPPMPANAPNLSDVRFGNPIALLNGVDLTGWRPHETDKVNGWSVADGMLVNSTPKTDFSPTGDYANLRTKAVFNDFWLHLEFLVEEQRNSGVYLRGMYEAQVVDRDSRMQGLQGVGAIFGAIAPSTNAGRPGGQWQTYDITLVNRHVTVVLNGQTVIDNQPISAPTPGAIHTHPTKPGPIYLQGDHTNVRYRNIYLAPVISH